MSNVKNSFAFTTESSIYSRNQHFARILEKLFSSQEMPQIDRWISLEFSKNKKFGSRDRKWYSEQIFSLIRHLYFILYQLRYENELEKFQTEINSPTKFWEAVKKISFEELIEALESNIQVEKSDNIFIQASIPLWLKPFLMRSFPETSDLNHFLELQHKRPALWIRLNHSEKREEVLKELKANNFDVKTSEQENTLAIFGEKSVYQFETFQKGFFEVQDYASQQIGYALDIKPGDYVWDACAGGGGKTIQIGSMLKNKGVLYATDIREYKLEEIKRRAKRAQFFNIRTIPWDGNIAPEFSKEILNRKGFNFILVDAPCSASGTWRRHPDAKYKIGKRNIQDLTNLQYKILSVIKNSIKDDGKIIYATCSVFKEENEDVVEKFLNKNPDFKLVEMKNLKSQYENSDFMFVAILQKM